MGLDQEQVGIAESDALSEAKLSIRPADRAFGAVTGLLTGGCVGWVCCWLVEEIDSVWYGASTGAFIGVGGGIALAVRHNRNRRDLISSDIGTAICTLYPVLPGLLILLGGVGVIRGEFAGVGLLGAACACPMLGLLIGGVFDRLYEWMLQRWPAQLR